MLHRFIVGFSQLDESLLFTHFTCCFVNINYIHSRYAYFQGFSSWCFSPYDKEQL